MYPIVKKYLILFIFISNASLSNICSADADNINYSNLSFTALPNNYQQILTEPHGQYDFGSGLTPYFAFKVATMSRSKTFEISSFVINGTIFYPMIILLNNDKQIESVVKTKIAVERQSLSRESSIHRFVVASNIKYIIITTDPALYGKSINYTSQHSNTLPIMSGSTVIYIPGPSYTQSNQIRFTDDVKIELLTPASDAILPFRKQDNFYFDMGVSFGSEAVANNPDGDSYTAGGGAVLGVGYSYLLPATRSLTLKTFLGFRYQGGQGGNEGIILSSSVVREYRYVNLGLGLYADVNNKVTDIHQNVTQFKNAIGYQLLAEWRISRFANLGLKFVAIDYETKTGQNYQGKLVALNISFYN